MESINCIMCWIYDFGRCVLSFLHMTLYREELSFNKDGFFVLFYPIKGN